MTNFTNFLLETLYKPTKFDFNARGGKKPGTYGGKTTASYQTSYQRHETALNNLHKSLSNHYTYTNSTHEDPVAREDDARPNHRSIEGYTNDSSTGQNNRLHKNFNPKVTNFGATKDHKAIKLDKVLSMHGAPHDFHVYTGLKESPERLFHKSTVVGLRADGKSKPNQEHIKAVVPSFMSTTINPNAATEFAHAPTSADPHGIASPEPYHPKYGKHVASYQLAKQHATTDVNSHGSYHGIFHLYHGKNEWGDPKHTLVHADTGTKIDGFEGNHDVRSITNSIGLFGFEKINTDKPTSVSRPTSTEQPQSDVHATVKAEHLSPYIHGKYHGTVHNLDDVATHTGNFTMHQHLNDGQYYIKHKESGGVLPFSGFKNASDAHKFATGSRDDLALGLKAGNRKSFAQHSDSFNISKPPSHVTSHEPEYGTAHLGYTNSVGRPFSLHTTAANGTHTLLDSHGNPYIQDSTSSLQNLHHKLTQILKLNHTSTYSTVGHKAAFDVKEPSVSSTPKHNPNEDLPGPAHVTYHGNPYHGGHPLSGHFGLHDDGVNMDLVHKRTGTIISTANSEWGKDHMHAHATNVIGLKHIDNHSAYGDELTKTNHFIKKKIRF